MLPLRNHLAWFRMKTQTACYFGPGTDWIVVYWPDVFEDKVFQRGGQKVLDMCT